MAKGIVSMDEEFGLVEEAPVAKKGKKRYTIFVDEEENAPNFISVGVNGKVWQIMRGVDVPGIPEEVIEVLRNAVAYRLIQTQDPSTGLVNTREQSFHRVPWRIVG